MTPSELLDAPARARRGARERARCRCWTPLRPGVSRSRRDGARALRGGGRARRGADPRRAHGEDRAGPRGRGPRARAHDLAAVFGVLREEFARCFVFCGRPRRRAPSSPRAPRCCCGARACASARSRSPGRSRRSADPAVDDHLGEQMLRVRGTARSTRSSRARSSARCGRTRCGSRPRGAGGRADREHPAPRDPDPRAARGAGRRGGARRDDAPDARRRRLAAGRRRCR